MERARCIYGSSRCPAPTLNPHFHSHIRLHPTPEHSPPPQGWCLAKEKIRLSLFGRCSLPYNSRRPYSPYKCDPTPTLNRLTAQISSSKQRDLTLYFGRQNRKSVFLCLSQAPSVQGFTSVNINSPLIRIYSALDYLSSCLE